MVVALKLPVVEFGGAKFYFDTRKAEKPFMALIAHGAANRGEDVAPQESWALADALFIEGCVGWEGVEGIEYSEAAKLDLPAMWRWKIAEGYIAAVSSLGEGVSGREERPTSSTPQE
jgi:hypothetical protein